jgi:uncharacterized protein YdhG (YjbR/CyaY superfamily)
MAATKKSGRAEADARTTGLTEEEKAAARETVKERKLGKANDEEALLAKIAEMPKSDRVMAERIHDIVKANAPALVAKTWYGMPAYANQAGKIVCFFQAADKFKARYATFGFDQAAELDEGAMWPTAWALTELTPDGEARIAELVKRAAG